MADHANISGAVAKARVAALVVLVLATLGLVLWMVFRGPVVADNPLATDPNARSGTLKAQPVEVDAGSFRLVLNQQPTMAAGETVCPLAYENPDGNGYAARLDVVLDKTGETLVATGVVRPGEYLESVRLPRPLDVGEHEATVQVTLLDGDVEISRMSAAIRIVVQ